MSTAVEYNVSQPYQVPHWKAIQVIAGTTPDGIPGRYTATAVAQWQSDNGLVSDGKVGPATLAAMDLEYVHGIDVSHHETVEDWAAVRAAGYRFAWLKATQGRTHVDTKLAEYAHGAAQAGLLVGYYHFADLLNETGRGDVHAQIDHFLEVIRGLPAARMPLVLDIEKEVPLTARDYTTWCETWTAAIRGYQLAGDDPEPAVYTSKRIVDRDLATDHQLGRYALWSPRYSGSFTTPPELAAGWPYWSIWQYTDKGTVPGIEGAANVDLNYADPTWFADL
jgi:lysozyme